MELTIDTASPVAGVALTDEGRLRAEWIWRSDRGHAAELLPAIDHLFIRAKADRGSVRAIFVNRGPGAYAGLRVGISAALALALAFDSDLLGYGRLEADAWPFLGGGRPVAAVHDAGRREYAWAIYRQDSEGIEEIVPPRMSDAQTLAAALPNDALIVGETPASLLTLLEGRTILTGQAGPRRPATGAALAWSRYAADARDNRLALTPLYLREPHITQSRRDREAAASGIATP